MVNIDELQVNHILKWIMENKDDGDEMEMVANAAFPYSTKFKKRYPQKK